ncbi:tash protein pest motif family [Burkholderia territorii]|nr:tash protein pest motif family [Burkholderia territorii]
MAVDVDVDSDVTLLLVDDKPVDSEPMPAEVDVDNDAIELVALDRPVDVDVDSDEMPEPVVLATA